MNNREGTLLLMHFATNFKHYEVELSKRRLIIELIVELLANNSDCSLEEASQCILKAFCTKSENSFAATAIDKGILLEEKDNKMDVISIEAMLSEAGITAESSRVLFRHINQFFGRKMFTSEKKRREYFQDNDFKPTCKGKN
jgi:hypothetical protein